MCQLKKLARKLDRILKNESQIGDTQYIQTVMQYLTLTLASQVYYHIGDHMSYNNLPNMMRRLIRCILDPQCDLQNLLELYPCLNEAFQNSIKETACDVRLFSSTGNHIHRRASQHHRDYFDVVENKVAFTVSIYWESAYTRGYAFAQNTLQH